MPRVAIAFGVILLLIGVGFYAATGAASVTALIPAFLGIPMALAGLVALRQQLRAHAMHATAFIGTLGFLACVPGLLKLPALLRGAPVLRPVAVVEQALTAVVCLVFVALCVRSFINARRSRAA